MPPTDFEFWTAVGTVGAVVVALGVALTQATAALVLSVRRRRLARRKVASLVSAWVEHVYSPSPGGDYFRRTVSLHVANESDEPVFKVEVLNGIASEHGTIQLGPLSAPRIIPVLPPKREFVYDVTMGILSFGDFAHDAFRGLIAEVSFRDHEGKRWERGFEGNLKAVRKPRAVVVAEAGDSLTFAQAGPIDNLYNPLPLVFSFVSAAADTDLDDEQFQRLLVEQASGWGESSAGEVAEVRDMLRNANVASHVWYPTPRIAYVRLVDELPGVAGYQQAHVLTLVWRNAKGWRMFGLGPHLPWMIPFAPGELDADPLDGREHA